MKRKPQESAPLPVLAPGGFMNLASLASFMRDPLLHLGARFAQHDVCRDRMAHLELLLLNDADAAAHVLSGNARNYKKSRQYEPLRLLLGDGLVVSEGDAWAAQRRTVRPVFRKHAIQGFAVTMAEITQETLKRWEGQREVDVFREMVRLAMDIVGRTVLSSESGFESTSLGQAINVGIRHVGAIQRNPLQPPLYIPTPGNRTFVSAMKLIRSSLLGLISERRRSATKYGDVLEFMLDARDEETGARMSDAEILDQVLAFFIAGFETTASTLCWIWVELARHPAVESRMHSEIDRVTSGAQVSPQHVPDFHYVTQVAKEALRLYPPAWAIGRQAICDDVVLGYKVPKGQDVIISPYCMHRNAQHWRDPLVFEPSHFDHEESKGRHPFAYIPFGAGPRTCIGNHFAMLELVLVVASIAQRHSLKLPAGVNVQPEAAAVLRLRGDALRMGLTPRAPGSATCEAPTADVATHGAGPR